MQATAFIAVDTVAGAFDWLAAWLPSADDSLTHRATVLCSTPRAHALRRMIAAERGQVAQLAGVRFVDPVVLARELLARSGEVRADGWEEVRRLRIHQCFESRALRRRLEYFSADQLRSGRGYADAFAQAIEDLEQSGLDAGLAKKSARELTAVDLLAARRLHDVAEVWAATDADRGGRRSSAQLLVEATEAVRESPEISEPFGSFAAVLAASPSSTLLQFLSALPDCTMLFLDARPLRAGTQRWRKLVAATDATERKIVAPAATIGDSGARQADPRVVQELVQSTQDRSKDRTPGSQESKEAFSELELVRRFLFARSDMVADPARPRSAGPDGTIDLEEYPGIEDEIEAAVSWIHEQIASRTPLEQIAVVVPTLDPHARLLLDRMSDASGPNVAAVPAFVSGGLPLGDSPAGLRVGGLLQSLAHGLDAETTIPLLAALRRADGQEAGARLSPSRVAHIVYGAGIVGGAPGNRRDALEWLPRLLQRRDTLRGLLSELPDSNLGEAEKRRHLHTRRDVERWIEDVEPLLPALAALQEVAALVVEGTSLRDVWQAVRTYATTYLHVPSDPADWLALLDAQLEPALSDPVADSVAGFAALAYLSERLARTRVPHGRFGEPRVFIGTAESAAGLPFLAVRVLGLAEGILPRTPHDDPIVPNDLRVRVEELLTREARAEVILPRLEDHVLEDLHALFRIVAGTGQRLALSTSRQWVDRSEREASGVMLEVAAALARQSRSPGEGDVPSAARLRSAYYLPGCTLRATYAQRSLWPRAVLSHIPRRDKNGWSVPASWCAEEPIRLDHVQSIAVVDATGTLMEMGGRIATQWTVSDIPGLVRHRPISASALTTLLQCPHRFLLSNILNLEEPAERPSTDTIDARSYGSLFHAAAEAFFREHGAAICTHGGTLKRWQSRAAEIASERFEAWRQEYPLRGEDAIGRERQRLVRQMRQLVEIEWSKPPRTYVGAEIEFGDPEALDLAVVGGTLYVCGQIDRVDRVGASTFSVRDLKTGRVHDFREEPANPGRDLQIGLYSLALEAQSPEVTVVYAAYVHPSAAQDPERAFEQSDVKELHEQTRHWLGVARGLLATGAFPRTPLAEDCRYCPFRPACGEGAQERSAANKEPLSPEVRAFAQLKQQGRDDDH